MIFSDQVESLTGITISASSTNPTNDQLTQYLKDGVIDVTAKWLIGHPQDTEDFQIASSEVTSNDSYSPKGTIVSVVRESGTNNDWRSCRKISPSMQSQVVDTESLSFSSKYHPTYMVGDNGKISVFPAASSNPDAFKVYYINNDPKNNTDNAELVHSMSDIRFFPTDKVYLVVLYAAIKSINNNMAGVITDLGTFSVSTVIADTLAAPSFTAVNLETKFNPESSPPTYTPPAIDAEDGELVDLRAGDSKIDFNDWFDTVGDYIETSQDAELAGAQLNKIGAYINAYQAAVQNALNVFNAANVEYQAELQQTISEAGLKLQEENQEYTAKLQKYQAEVQSYAAEVNAEVTEQATKIQTEGTRYQWLQDRAAALQAEYMAAFATPQPAGGAGGGR